MQKNSLVDIDVNFQYTGGASWDNFEEIAMNTLQYQAYFESLDWTKEELDYISKQLVETGKVFAVNQGFGPGAHGPASNRTLLNGLENTGNLYNSIKSEVNGRSISFYNDALNSRGQPYAGHMEYGFHDRQGNFIPARPFMRPAFHAVAEGSKGNFRSIMKGLLENLWSTRGFSGITTMAFGHSKGSSNLFWKQNGLFSQKVSQMSRIKELRGSSHRRGLSLTNKTKKGPGAKGFKSAANRKDFRRGSNRDSKGRLVKRDRVGLSALDRQKGRSLQRSIDKRGMRSSSQERKTAQENRKGKGLEWKGSGSANRQNSGLGSVLKQNLYSDNNKGTNKGGNKASSSRNEQKSSNSRGKTIMGMHKDEFVHEYVKAGFTWEQAVERWNARVG